MALEYIDYDTAIRNRNRQAQWASAHDRLRPSVWPVIKPSFSITPGATIFTIGSCFARNIETHLLRLGYRIPIRDFIDQSLIRDPRMVGLLNKYTPVSMKQEIEWVADLHRRDKVPDEADCEKYAYTLKDGSVIDNNMAMFIPMPREHFLQRRRKVFETVRKVFDAECVVITPGLAEAWYDAEREMFIQEVVTHREPTITKNLKFVMLDYDACLEALNATIATIRKFNPEAKFLITTSPVPVSRTFTDDDVITANTYAKSVLRAACGKLPSLWKNLDYFPSFESVTLTRDWSVMESDLLHVDNAFIGRIVSRVVESYCTAVSDGERLFQQSLEEADDTAAIARVRRAIAQTPESVPYRSRLGELLCRTGALEEAESEFRWCAEKDTDFLIAPNLLELAQCYFQKGDLARSRALLQEAARERSPVSVHGRLGAVCLAMNDLEGAESAFRGLVKANPVGGFAYYRLADTLRRMRRYEEAIAALETGLQYEPRNESLNMLMGHCCRALGRNQEAETWFRGVLEIDPEHANAKRHLEALGVPAAA